MKNLIFILLLPLAMIPERWWAQGMPVYDNTNFISLTKQLVESAKQTSELIKTVEFLKQQKENLEKVSSVIRQLKAVKRLAENHQKVIRSTQQDLGNILNSEYIKAEEIQRITESFNMILDASLEDMDFIRAVLSSDYLKMTDADRMEIIKAREQRSAEMLSLLKLRARRYREIIELRKLQQKINSRSITY